MNSKVSIALLILYAIFTQATPLTPSIYTLFVDTVHMIVNTVALYLVYLYYRSLPDSRKTVLHEIMIYLIVILGFRTTMFYIGFVLNNLFPEAVVSVLYNFPNTFCWLITGLFNQLAGLFVVIIVILRAAFNAFPHIFLNLNDTVVMKGVWSLTTIYIIEVNLHHYLQNYGMCDEGFIQRLQTIVELEIDESKINTYSGLSPLSLLLLLLVLVSEFLSRAIIKIRLYKRSGNKFATALLPPTKVLPLEVCVVSTLKDDLELQYLPVDKPRELSNNDQQERTQDNSDVNESENSVIHHSALVHNTESGEPSDNQYNDYTNGLDVSSVNRIIYVLPVSPAHTQTPTPSAENLSPTLNSKEFDSKRLGVISKFFGEIPHSIETNHNENTQKELTDMEQNQSSSLNQSKVTSPSTNPNIGTKKSSSVSEGLVGFNIIIGYIILINVLRILNHSNIQGLDKTLLNKVYIWANYISGKLVTDFLSIYWLLRKHHSRQFAKRKLNIWKERALSKMF